MIVILLLFYEVYGIVNPYGPTVVRDYSSCINSLIETNFDKPGLLIFGHTEKVAPPVANIRAGVLKKIHESLNFSVEIMSPHDRVEVCYGNSEDESRVLHRDQFKPILIADYYVIIVGTYKEFIYLVSRMIRARSWNSSAKFIIFLINFTYVESETTENVENILSCLFRYNVIDIIVAVSQTGKNLNALIYSWKPYDPPKFCGYFNETARNRLVLENMCENGIVKNKKLLFENKIPRNMMKCIFQILAIERQPFFSRFDEDPNIEKVLINQMLRKFNFTIKYKLLNEYRGERNESGMWNGALTTLITKGGHVLLGGIFPDFDVHEDFECSSSYLGDSYAWVVPSADHSPPWIALVIIFQISVWWTMGAGFVLCVITWKILGHMSDDSQYHKSIFHCILNTCIISLGFSAYVRPMRQSLRIFFVFLNLYCILLITAYQTKLITVLQNPTLENQIDTIEDLVASGLKFGGTEELHDLFADSNDPFDNIIYEKWIDVEEVKDALVDVAVYRNFSVLCSRLELAHLSAILPELTDRYGRLRYFSFKSDTFSVPSEIIALRGFPFMKNFSRTLEKFKEIGVNDGVRRRFAKLNAMKRTKLLLSLDVEKSNFIPLSMKHMHGGFHILIFGIISGCAVLFIEIMINCKYIKRFFAFKLAGN